METLTLAKVIQDARVKKGMTLSALAKEAGISIVMLSDIENGKRIPARGRSLQGLSKSLDIEYGVLLKVSKESKIYDSIANKTDIMELKMSLARNILSSTYLTEDKIKEMLKILSKED